MSENKSKAFIYIILIIFGISLIGVIKSLPGASNNFLCWISFGFHVLVIGHFLNLLYPNYTLMFKRVTLVLAFISIYMAIGTGLFHYQGEGSYRNDILKSNVGNEITYYISFHNGLNLPLDVDATLIFEESGLKKISSVVNKAYKKGTKDDDRTINLTFKVLETEAALPTKGVVKYRIFKIIPMVNVIELKWPEFSSYQSGKTSPRVNY